MAGMHTYATIRFWIQESIGTDYFTFKIESRAQKGEGYMGELIFVKVNLEKPIDGKDVLHLVIKTSKETPGLEKSFSIQNEQCKREVLFYGKILKEYNELQKEKKLQKPFDMVPKCYKIFEEGGYQVIVLENVKKVGYESLPRADTMNDLHLKLGLQTYAKLHALSFALKDQRRETFEKISVVCTPLIKDVLDTLKILFDCARLVETLKEAGRTDLSTKYEKYINEKSIFYRFRDLSYSVCKDQAILHTDCHNGNIFFKYKDNERTAPQHMILIDFEGACTHSPIIDLSYFLMINLSPEDFPKLKHFVEYYYSEFCSFLKELGSDANTLYPRSTFDEHVKTYIYYGTFLSLPFLELVYLETKNMERDLARLVAHVDNLFNGPYS